LSEKDNVVPFRQPTQTLQAFVRTHDFGLDRSRPYNGQPWTMNGERGTQTLPQMTLRDLADVIVATLRSSPEGGDPSWRDWNDLALAMNVAVAIEEEFPEHFKWLAEHPI